MKDINDAIMLGAKKIHDLREENKRLNNIINKISKMLEADTHCENIYYAIGVLLNKRFFDIKMVDNKELLNILGSDKECTKKNNG